MYKIRMSRKKRKVENIVLKIVISKLIEYEKISFFLITDVIF